MPEHVRAVRAREAEIAFASKREIWSFRECVSYGFQGCCRSDMTTQIQWRILAARWTKRRYETTETNLPACRIAIYKCHKYHAGDVLRDWQDIMLHATQAVANLTSPKKR